MQRGSNCFNRCKKPGLSTLLIGIASLAIQNVTASVKDYQLLLSVLYWADFANAAAIGDDSTEEDAEL